MTSRGFVSIGIRNASAEQLCADLAAAKHKDIFWEPDRQNAVDGRRNRVT
jgi:hypothetical protein